jgi:hypothetical protein
MIPACESITKSPAGCIAFLPTRILAAMQHRRHRASNVFEKLHAFKSFGKVHEISHKFTTSKLWHERALKIDYINENSRFPE